VGENTFLSTMNVYRLHFSCENIGRYIGNTKRKIRWCFGFTNLHDEGKCGIEFRGEEHEVELIWSVMSNKVNIFWNKRNISHYFPEKWVAGKIDVCWESMSGEKFRIMAHESPIRSTPQYDFFIDGISIFSLPHVSELSRTTIMFENSVRYEDLSETSMDSTCSSEGVTGYNNDNREPPDMGFRLSLAGFSPCDPLDDDLTASYSFANILEYLREFVTSLIPNSEDMVSRSIINALSEDKSVCEHHSRIFWDSSSSIGSIEQKPTQIEANILYETTEWANLHLLFSPQPDVQEQKRLFLQKQMNNVFVHARHQRLTEEIAARILLDIASLLDFPICSSFKRERDTIIFRDLKNDTNLDALSGTVVAFEELREMGIASNRTFAFCRFASERGPLKVLAAADQGTLIINGTRPNVSLIQRPLILDRPGLLSRRAISTPLQRQDECACKCSLSRRKSHQRNTISIDTLIVERPPFLRLINET